MTSAQLPGPARILLWLSPALAVIVAFFAAIPWLDGLDDALVKLIAAAVSIFVIGYALFVAIRCQRGADEVARAGDRYAFQIGGIGGWVASMLFLLIPPLQNLPIDAANVLGAGSVGASDRESVQVALAFGVCLVVLMQTLGTMIAGLVWRRRVGWR